jgi:hypothetical protein
LKKKELEILGEVEYAKLNKEQENKLRQLEQNFNAEFGKDFYFMVMKKDKN